MTVPLALALLGCSVGQGPPETPPLGPPRADARPPASGAHVEGTRPEPSAQPAASATGSTPGVRVEAAYFVALDRIALPLGCYDAAARGFVRGGACVGALPPSAELVSGAERVRVTGRTTFACGPTNETFAGVRLAQKPASPLLVWTSGGAGQRLFGPSPSSQADLDGDGRVESVSVGKDGIFVGSGADRKKVSSPDTSGTFTLLGATDADGDRRLEVFYGWDYGHGWGYAIGLFVKDRLEEIARVECGS